MRIDFLEKALKISLISLNYGSSHHPTFIVRGVIGIRPFSMLVRGDFSGSMDSWSPYMVHGIFDSYESHSILEYIFERVLESNFYIITSALEG